MSIVLWQIVANFLHFFARAKMCNKNCRCLQPQCKVQNWQRWMHSVWTSFCQQYFRKTLPKSCTRVWKNPQNTPQLPTHRFLLNCPTRWRKRTYNKSTRLEVLQFFASNFAQSVGTPQTAKLKRPFQQNTPQLITSHLSLITSFPLPVVQKM